MNGKIGVAFEQGYFKLLGEKSLGQILAFFGEGDVGQFVPRGLDDFQFEFEFGKSSAALGQ